VADFEKSRARERASLAVALAPARRHNSGDSLGRKKAGRGLLSLSEAELTIVSSFLYGGVRLLGSWSTGSGGLGSCCFSGDGERILASSSSLYGEDSRLSVWGVDSIQQATISSTHNVPSRSFVQSACFAPDGQSILACFVEGDLVWHNPTSGDIQKAAPRMIEAGLCGTLAHVCYSPDGTTILCAIGNVVVLRSAATGELLATLEGHSDRVTDCSYSPNGKSIVSASNDFSVKEWNATTGKLRRTLKGHTSAVRSCSFSPDSKLLLTGSLDCTMRVWKAGSGELVQTMVNSAFVECCSFSPCGKWALSGDCKGCLNMWSVRTGGFSRTLGQHTSRVKCCSFSQTGTRALSAYADGVVKIWSQ
jgi:WD40 repeat protein